MHLSLHSSIQSATSREFLKFSETKWSISHIKVELLKSDDGRYNAPCCCCSNAEWWWITELNETVTKIFTRYRSIVQSTWRRATSTRSATSARHCYDVTSRCKWQRNNGDGGGGSSYRINSVSLQRCHCWRRIELPVCNTITLTLFLASKTERYLTQLSCWHTGSERKLMRGLIPCHLH